jgi:hypothetical protein
MADKQTYYINKNGQSTSDRYAESEFKESSYIFKLTVKGGRGEDGDQIPASTFITRKINSFKEVFGIKYLNAPKIKNSGIMHMANELKDEDNVLTTDSMREIAEQFNTGYTYGGGKKYRKTTTIKNTVEGKEFEELYGYKMRF